MSSPTLNNLNTISLYYKEGTSDKEYHLDIVGNEAEGFKVNYRHGRRGQALKSGSRNKVPVDYATARKLFDSKVKEQLAEGYTQDAAGTPYQSPEGSGKVSGLVPQLLNDIEEDEAESLLNDDNWIMQEKKDGVRCMIRKKGKAIEGINKRGLITSLPLTTEGAIREACGEAPAILDGELVGEVYWLFDLLSVGVHATGELTYKGRLSTIDEWFGESFTSPFFRLIPTAVGKASKRAMYKQLKADGAEGVVFTKADSLYKPGRPASGGYRLKFKFYKTATVRVKALNTQSSFQMEMLSKGDWVGVGDCTYYDKKAPKPGDFVEVRYLYMKGVGGSLYGPPVLLDIRKDCTEDDCMISQVKYMQEKA